MKSQLLNHLKNSVYEKDHYPILRWEVPRRNVFSHCYAAGCSHYGNCAYV